MLTIAQRNAMQAVKQGLTVSQLIANGHSRATLLRLHQKGAIDVFKLFNSRDRGLTNVRKD